MQLLLFFSEKCFDTLKMKIDHVEEFKNCLGTKQENFIFI